MYVFIFSLFTLSAANTIPMENGVCAMCDVNLFFNLSQFKPDGINYALDNLQKIPNFLNTPPGVK